MKPYILLLLLSACASSESTSDHDEAFHSWDENRDGQITKQEYSRLLKSHDPQKWTEETLREATENMFMPDVDTNEDG